MTKITIEVTREVMCETFTFYIGHSPRENRRVNLQMRSG